MGCCCSKRRLPQYSEESPPPAYDPEAPPVDQNHSNITYITNVYYQQPPPPEPVHAAARMGASRSAPPVYDAIEWVPTTSSGAQAYSHRAVVAGKEGYDSSPLWVIRARHNGDLIPGKLAATHRDAYIPYSGKEVPVHNFELLCAPHNAVRWIPSSDGNIPKGAIPAGNTNIGETLYIGRASFMRSVTPGKVHPSHACLYISFDGKEVPHRRYEVLCLV